MLGGHVGHVGRGAQSTLPFRQMLHGLQACFTMRVSVKLEPQGRQKEIIANCYIEHSMQHDWDIWSLLYKHMATPVHRILNVSHSLDVCIAKVATIIALLPLGEGHYAWRWMKQTESILTHNRDHAGTRDYAIKGCCFQKRFNSHVL
jgi:hypothetical protein